MPRGRNVTAETRTPKCGIICGENAMKRFETVSLVASRFIMGDAPLSITVSMIVVSISLLSPIHKEES